MFSPADHQPDDSFTARRDAIVLRSASFIIQTALEGVNSRQQAQFS